MPNKCAAANRRERFQCYSGVAAAVAELGRSAAPSAIGTANNNKTRHNMKTKILTLWIGIAFAFQTSAQFTNRFDTGDEGWRVVDLDSDAPWTAPLVGGPYLPTHVQDGPSSGFIRTVDPTYGPVFYFAAPTNYLGSRSNYYGGTLSFRVSREASVFIDNLPDVILVGGGLALTVDAGPGPAANGVWTSYSVLLATNTAWRRGTLAGPPATHEEFVTVLSSLERLLIRGEFGGEPTDAAALDDVVLMQGCFVASIRVSEVEICWPSISNSVYQVDYRSDLTTNTWVPLYTNVIGDGTVICRPDRVTQPQRFYRVVCQ
jgi:hypothetical protein